MPHRRTPKKGSFGGHFDELVKHFQQQGDERRDHEKRREEASSVHERLFERAWRENRRNR